MNNYGAVLSSNFMCGFLGQRGKKMQFHIVQEHGSASMVAVSIKKEQKMKVGGSGEVWCFFCFLFVPLSAVMWPPPPRSSTQNKACNWVWVCPLCPFLDGKG